MALKKYTAVLKFIYADDPKNACLPSYFTLQTNTRVEFVEKSNAGCGYTM